MYLLLINNLVSLSTRLGEIIMDNDFTGYLDDNHIFRQSFRLDAINCTRYNVANLVWYLQIMQEIAATHSSKLNLSSEDLEDQGLEWVILRNIITVNRYVKWGEVIHLETWAHEKYKLFFPRTIIGYDENGNKLFESTSYWALLNKNRNFRPIPPKPYLDKYGYPKEDKKRLPPKYPDKLIIEEEYKMINNTYVNSIYDDIDINKHTNNISYFKWMLTLMSDEFRDTHKISSIDISWMQQTYSSDKNNVRVYNDKTNPMTFKYDIEKEDVDANKTISSIAIMNWDLSENLL